MHSDESPATKRWGIVVVMLMFINVTGGIIGYVVDHLLPGIPGIVTLAGSTVLATLIAVAIWTYLRRFIRAHS